MTQKNEKESLAEGISKLRKITHKDSSVNVCRHLADESSKNQEARYVATQLLDDSYFLLWCCESCAEKYHVPKPGVLVVDNDAPLESLVITRDSTDKDQNPYKNLIDSCKGFTARKDSFYEKFKRVNQDQILNSKYKVEFGKEIIGISSD
ncbi:MULTISPECIES: hypothetical protein [unclassified Microbulbifer]|uniref:hypothetical protein n=1 Tax=unclassified Microbulbifer TaxID=2619833 RepID=UPI0027E58E77|nr:MULTISPECIES: hypothetical protein [unclassified Microbulbifer]